MRILLTCLICAANPVQSVPDRTALIEQLSIDPQSELLPTDTNDPGWTLFEPQGSTTQWVELDGCYLTLFAQSAEGIVFSRRDVDLAAARIVPDTQTGRLYTWTEALFSNDPAGRQDVPPPAAGTLVFEALREGAITLTDLEASSPAAQAIPATLYVVFQTPHQETISALAAALHDHQQEQCMPLG